MTLGRFIAMLVVAAALVAGAAVVAAGAADDKGLTSATVTQLRVPAPPLATPPQAELGGLPEPEGAAHVDLTKPQLLPPFDLRGPSAGLAFDFESGTLLWRHNARLTRPIASLTKLMTGLLAVERLGPRDRVVLTRDVDQVGGSRMPGLKPGRVVRADVLLKGLMISSSNNAAVALAVGGAGSQKAWVSLMNKRARLLGLTCTQFVDPHGLSPGNRSCPDDLATLAMRAMSEPRIVAIAHKRYARVWPGAGKKVTLLTTNHLLRDHYPGAIGLKTGFTNLAGFCFVAVVERKGRRIGIVLLHDKDPWASARRVVREAVRAGLFPAA